MLLTAPLAAILLLVVSVAADPIVVRKSPVSLPIARHLNITGAHDLIRKDQARARNMFAASKVKRSGSSASVSITNEGVVYGASVGIGSPPTFYNLLIDTGCTNIWIGGGKSYVHTSSSVALSGTVCESCGSGFCGEGFSDIVTLGPTLVFRASIGVASASSEGFDGILGLGPPDLTTGTLSIIPDILFSQGIIPDDLVSVSFEPTTNVSAPNGELTFGGTDSTKFTGTITFIPVTTTFPASEFWGINGSIRYGASTTILSTTAGIVDSGTTLLLISTDAFNRYKTATGAVLDASTGLLKVTSTQFSNLQSLFFTAGGISFELTANAQIWPRSLNTFIGGTTSSIYLVVNDIGSPTGSGLDFINGYTFLERFYSVFDTTNNRVGFANTPFTTATTN
ncbi:aspartic peptidase A1 [Lactarius akahatsu]|uniref:Aspartic peptidase A1 n=1 Tax=Lactarius akahatsu TaxID=416441 RepID=A0AAD4LAY2_9AGAM|nr:aspartic peptidase A1 [Lactarius akahatsu]